MSFRNPFGKQIAGFPFGTTGNWNDPNWVGKYIDYTVQQALMNAGGAAPEVQAETFETIHHVVVKIMLGEQTVPSQVRLTAYGHYLHVEGLPEGKYQTIELPCSVTSKGSKAVCKNGILQIHLRKIEPEEGNEIPIQY